MRFKILCLLSSTLFFYLCLECLFDPDGMITDFGFEALDGALFMTRRGSMLMLGPAVLLFFARNLRHSPGRQAIALSIGATMVGLAVLGLFELARGVAGTDILFPVTVETLVGMSYLAVWVYNRRRKLAAQ